MCRCCACVAGRPVASAVVATMWTRIGKHPYAVVARTSWWHCVGSGQRQYPWSIERQRAWRVPGSEATVLSPMGHVAMCVCTTLFVTNHRLAAIRLFLCPLQNGVQRGTGVVPGTTRCTSCRCGRGRLWWVWLPVPHFHLPGCAGVRGGDKREIHRAPRSRA